MSVKNGAIPKKLHFVWVGDDSCRPDSNIQTWIAQHTDFEVTVWNNDDLKNRVWRTKHLMDDVIQFKGPYAAIADLMRWEILYEEGGIALDADSICLNRLPDWLLDCDLFATWENEYSRPGLIANGYVGCVPGHGVIGEIVRELSELRNWPRRFSWSRFGWRYAPAWKITGPGLFTSALMSAVEKTATILPSHFFIPIHYSGTRYVGQGPVYGCELFSSTPDGINTKDGFQTPDELVSFAKGLFK